MTFLPFTRWEAEGRNPFRIGRTMGAFAGLRTAEIERLDWNEINLKKNVDQVALEAGNSPVIIFQYYRELVTEETANGWFGITPDVVKEVWRSGQHMTQ